MNIEQRLTLLEKRIGIKESSYKKATKEELSKFKNYVTKFLKKKPANEEDAFNKWYKEVYKNAKVEESIQKVNGNRIKVYDNGGEDAKNGTLDRITVVFLDFEKERNGSYQAVAASETGIGFYSHTSAQLGRHLGKEISFSDLDPRLQKMIKNEFEEYNESTKRPRKKVIETSIPNNLNKLSNIEQQRYLCSWVEDNYGFELFEDGNYVFCTLENNPKAEESFNYLEEAIDTFNRRYGTHFHLKGSLQDNVRWGESYVII